MSCSCNSYHTVEEVLGKTLLDGLVCTIDQVRDLHTTFGERRYQVSLVWTRWSGGERGIGQETVITVLNLLPTPKVSDVSQVRRDVQSFGTEEMGELKISEISMTYSENLLVGKGMVGDGPIPLDVSFYWEVYNPAAGLRRRFIPKSAPNINPSNFEWVISLVRASGDRDSEGMPT